MPFGLIGRKGETAKVDFYELSDLSESLFEVRKGNKVTLFQDAHCEGDLPAPIVNDYGQPDTMYVPQNCFEQIYQALLDAKRFIYITGWSVDTKISLVRRMPIFQEEGCDDIPPAGKMTIGELLKYKASQGVRVLLHVWDEALSVNIGGFTTAGVMATYDEETKKYFSKTGVICKLSYRTGSSKDNQFLWTHHQKSVIVDAPVPQLSGYASIVASNSQSSYMSLVTGAMNKVTISEDQYARKDQYGNRFVISSFMTTEHSFSKIWDDKGSWCKPHAVSIFRPSPPDGWHILGDIAQRGSLKVPNQLTKAMVVKEPPAVPGNPPLLALPVSYRPIWPESKPFSCKGGNVVFWEPLPPEGYAALGYVATDSMAMPPVNLIRCVHKDALVPAHIGYEEDHQPIWKNAGKVRNSIGGGLCGLFSIIPSGSGLTCGTFAAVNLHKIDGNAPNDYFSLRRAPLGVDVCPKPGQPDNEEEEVSQSVPVRPINGKRRIIAFVGGLDLTYGRWDTPSHTLFSTLSREHIDDYLHGWCIPQEFGPREPWHDIHAKFEGPIARDVMTNFEQRWMKQGKPRKYPLFHVGSEFISVNEEEINGPEAWCSRLCRSIDPFSAVIPKVDNSIQFAYVTAIRKARRFIYIENQYFMGSAKWWLQDNDTACLNLIPYEIAHRISESILAGDKNPVCAYILLPLYPEGFPLDSAIQEQLRWQWNSMEMMYRIVHDACQQKGLKRTAFDFLQFWCVGQREEVSLCTAARKDPPKNSRSAILIKSRRVPIYVHSKMMIIDDNYIILGSANINERSMAGDRDSEIAIENWQPGHLAANKPRGCVHRFRMSLWSEHAGKSYKEFLEPNSPECSKLCQEIGEKNWDIFAGPTVVNMKSHLMRYPLRVKKNGAIVPDPEKFPDTKAPVKGQASVTMPDLLTC